jgi:hypothetical protein
VPGSLLDQIPFGEARLYQGVLIRCQSYHGNYACSFCGAAMSGDDGTDSSTEVPTVRCAWVPAALSYHARHLMLLSPEDSALVSLPDTESPWVRLLGTRVYFEPGHELGLQWANGW